MYWGSPLVTKTMTATLGSAAAISSRAKAQVTESRPTPPQASGVVMPSNPSSARALSWGQGYSPFLSYSGARGHRTSLATRRTVSSTSLRSWVRVIHPIVSGQGGKKTSSFSPAGGALGLEAQVVQDALGDEA